MDATLSIIPIIMMLFNIAIPVCLIVVVYYFYKLFKIRNEELKKQNELLNRIVNVLERS
ncbi:hypothetical protein [Bacillus sp. UNCCL81]|uniref:hypothetical protein n=1 Tax=Bacillus sp. UNCCL81 TaxID=1502755 RepID=UPI0008E58C96|nr:hypothetical protein [Bacillus sp. UNCCL81]SFC21000.1 hypothetical protein SAMN02799633_00091 [Bacillus sp. UNCCL81]